MLYDAILFDIENDVYFSFLVEEVCNAIEHLNILNTENEENIQILSVLQDILNQVAIAFYGQDVK